MTLQQVKPPALMKPELRARLGLSIEDAFGRDDFHQVDMRSLAADCGMSFATIYRYFPDKESMLFDFISEWLNELRSMMLDGMMGLESPREKFRRAIWIQLDYWERNPKKATIILMTVPLKTWMRDTTFVQQDFLQFLVKILDDAQARGQLNPAITSMQMLDMLTGSLQRTVVMWIHRGQRYSLVDEFEPLFSMFWRGISAAKDHNAAAPQSIKASR